jgi:integrase
MAHIEKRNRSGKVVWRARYRAPDGRERSKTFAKKSDAEQWLDAVRGDLAHGSYVDPRGGKTRFADYARVWQASRVHRPTTEVHVEGTLRNHILPAFGDRQIGSIRRSEIQGFVKDLSLKLQPSTVEVVYRHLASIFRSAVYDRLIAVTPCDRIALPKIEVKRVMPLETAHVLALTNAIADRYKAMITLAAGTGMRQGECFGLTLPNVDFPRRRLHVVQQLQCIQNHPLYLCPPKTPASVRTIPLPDVVLTALMEHLDKYPVGGEDEFVFSNHYGEPIRRTRFSDVWRKAARAAQLPKGASFHSLRHYYASLLIRHGESVKTVQARLGHASAAETLDTYSHLWPDSEDRTRDAVDAVLLDVPRPSRGPTVRRHRKSPGHGGSGGESACTPDSVTEP